MRVRHQMNRLSGFMPDISPDQLPPDASSLSMNFKEDIDGWSKSDGYKETHLEPGNEKTHMAFWSPAEGDDRWFIAGKNTIVFYQGNVKTDATRESGQYNNAGEWFWNSLDFNGLMCFNNGVDNPQYFKDTGKFDNFPALADKVRFRNIRKYKAYMFGLGVDMGTGYNDNEIYWSHPADPGTLPANWDFADPASDAGKTFLPSAGYVVDALELGETLFIYKSDSTWSCRFIGGQFVFSFDKKWSSSGILTNNCVTEFEGQHFVVTQTDIIVHNGVTMRSIADKRVKKFFFNDISREHFQRAFVVKRPDTNEIYVYYPSRDAVDGYMDSVLIYHWINNNWEYRKIPNLTSAAYGNALPETVDAWDLTEGPWEREGTWRLGEDAKIFAPTLYQAYHNVDKLQVPSADGLGNNLPIPARWERQDITLGPTTRDGVVIQNYENYKTIAAITFDVETSENFKVYLGTRDYLNDSIVWEDYGEFTPYEQRTLDLILTTGFLSIRLETNAANLQLRNLHIEFEIGGEIP